MYSDSTLEAITPIEIKVSIEVVRCRAATNAARWNGQAHQVATGTVIASIAHCQPWKRSDGANARTMDKSPSGAHSSSATASRGHS